MSFAQRYCEFINWLQTVNRGADHKDLDEREVTTKSKHPYQESISESPEQSPELITQFFQSDS